MSRWFGSKWHEAVADGVEDLSLWCDGHAFQPVREVDVRWLDWDHDYELAATAFPDEGLSRADWLAVRDIGFTYCAVVEGERVLSRAAVWRGVPYGERGWEVAAVWTRDDRRGRGLARSTVSFVTEYVIANPRRGDSVFPGSPRRRCRAGLASDPSRRTLALL